MRGVGNIFNKEMARVFKDRRMVFSVFILPVIIMVVIMTIVGQLVTKMMTDIEGHTPFVAMMNEPDSFKSYLEEIGAEYNVYYLTDDSDLQTALEDVYNGKIDLVVEFPKDFDAMVADYNEGDKVPQVKTYYNPSEDYSSQAYSTISQGVLEEYRLKLLGQRVGNMDNIQIFTVNSDNPESVQQDSTKAMGKTLGMMLPYFITIMLFAGAMGLGVDMITGEKERGTMASLLLSPIKRSSIALGKVFALMVFSAISAVIYILSMGLGGGIMVGTMFAKLSSSGLDMTAATSSSISTGMTGVPDFAALFQMSPLQILLLVALMVAIAFFYTVVVALIAAYARSPKEAQSYCMPAYMVVLVSGMIVMFPIGKETSIFKYLIPLYNNSLCLQDILTGEITPLHYGIALAETVILGFVGLFLIVKAFNSEKIMNS
ncbi:MAG: ABC transporter permease [Lachnospiraceae bacterium]|jgi:sodium transport system permease protein|nr:ABC transporter permease [Lachnospiraceae bacterium]